MNNLVPSVVVVRFGGRGVTPPWMRMYCAEKDEAGRFAILGGFCVVMGANLAPGPGGRMWHLVKNVDVNSLTHQLTPEILYAFLRVSLLHPCTHLLNFALR